jgi:hypothetical protein
MCHLPESAQLYEIDTEWYKIIELPEELLSDGLRVSIVRPYCANANSMLPTRLELSVEEFNILLDKVTLIGMVLS